jgi:hypothetical protein
MYVSNCCEASVIEGVRREYPLGGRTWGMDYKLQVCDKCKKECDEVAACEVCGEISCKGECEELKVQDEQRKLNYELDQAAEGAI